MKRVDMELIRRTVVGGTVADGVFSPMVEAILHLVDREGNSLGTVTGRVQARRRTEGEERVEDERKEFGFDKIALNSNMLRSPEASYAAVADADPFQAFGRLGDEDDEGLATDLSLSKAFKSEQNINSPLFKTVVTHSLPTRRRTDGVGAGMNRNPKPTPFESYDFTQDFHAANDNSINGNSVYGNSITGNAVNGNSVNGIAANDNAAKRAASNGNSVAGNAGNSNPFNGNAVKRIAVNGNAVNGNAVNGNAVNGNAVIESRPIQIQLPTIQTGQFPRSSRPFQRTISSPMTVWTMGWIVRNRTLSQGRAARDFPRRKRMVQNRTSFPRMAHLRSVQNRTTLG